MDGQAKKIGKLALGGILCVAIIVRVPENGWGSLVCMLSIIAMKVIRRPFETQVAENVVVEQRGGMVHKVLSAILRVSLAITLVHLIFGVFLFVNYSISSSWTTLGVVINAVALYYFWRCHVDLGLNFSRTLTLVESQTLVTEGVYKYVRHPMYSSMFLYLISWPLLIHNWIASLAPLAAFCALYFLRVDNEEQMLQDRFGQEYVDYMSITGRIVPKLSSVHS